MKSFLIKIGKIINTLKKEGIRAGGWKTLGYFFVFLKYSLMLKSGDILFITSGVGDSARFRAHNVAEELRLHGLQAFITMPENPFLLKLAGKFKVFIFHKPVFTPKIKMFVEKIKAQKKEIIFDADDLLFDPAYLDKIDYFKNINSLEKTAYENGLGREILSDPYVKVCTTTTSFLADILRAYSKQVFIVPNKFSNKDLEIAADILKNKITKSDNEIKIGYFSGSMGHNKDFAVIADALLEIMEKYPRVKLILAGPLDIGNKLNKFNDRIKHSPFVAREKHFANVADVDINLAPLEVGNPFCESKSEIKFSGAGILMVPTVASATQTFGEAISDGIDGFVANGTDEWVEKLEKLITDKEFRINMGKLARDKALARYSNKNSHNEEYYNYLRSKLL